jgi:hypothetical protein
MSLAWRQEIAAVVWAQFIVNLHGVLHQRVGLRKAGQRIA